MFFIDIYPSLFEPKSRERSYLPDWYLVWNFVFTLYGDFTKLTCPLAVTSRVKSYACVLHCCATNDKYPLQRKLLPVTISYDLLQLLRFDRILLHATCCYWLLYNMVVEMAEKQRKEGKLLRKLNFFEESLELHITCGDAFLKNQILVAGGISL